MTFKIKQNGEFITLNSFDEQYYGGIVKLMLRTIYKVACEYYGFSMR